MRPLTLTGAFTSWQLAPAAGAVLTVLAAAYLTAVWLIRRRTRRGAAWPASRAAAFILGLATIAVATQSSVGVYDDALLSVHMVQHLLLIMVAPPLLIFGRPVTLLLHVTRNPLHASIKRLIRSRPVSWLTRPPVAVTLYAALVIGTHLTPLMNLAVENAAVHDAEHVLYLVVGYLYFLPVIGSEPIKWRMPALGRYLLLLVTMPVDTGVGVVLMLAPHELFSAYARSGRTWGPSPVTDLHEGGLIMLAGSDLIMTVLAVILAAGFVRAREFSPHGVAGDLDAYNAYLAVLNKNTATGRIP